MRFKSSYFLILLGALALVCLENKSVAAIEANSTTETVIAQTGKPDAAPSPGPVLPSPGTTQSPGPVLPSPGETQVPVAAPDPKPDLSSKEQAIESVRRVHKPINERYDKQIENRKVEAEQRQQERKQQYEETVKAYEERVAQEEAERKQAEAKQRAQQSAQAPSKVQQPAPSSVGTSITTEPVASSDGAMRQSDEVTRQSGASTIPAMSIAQSPTMGQAAPQAKSSSKTSAKKLNLGQVTFACGEESGTPATIAKLNNRQFGLIMWTSTLFADKGFDPKTRCSQVSARLEAYRKSNAQVFVTPGKINGQSVLCVTTQEDGGCGDGIANFEGLLFTLKPNSQPQSTLEQLTAVLASEENQPREPLKE